MKEFAKAGQHLALLVVRLKAVYRPEAADKVKCRRCGETYSRYGDGWDEGCPNCTDQSGEEAD